MTIELPAQEHKIRILIAEGHELIRMGLRALVESSPTLMLVAETHCFKQLPALIESTRPDVILLDVLLNNGQCLQHIPQLLKTFPKTKILAFTGYLDDNLHLTAFQSGAMGIVAKHQGTELILKAIHTIHAGEVWFDRQITKLLRQVQIADEAPSNGNAADSTRFCLTKRECSIACLASKGLSAKKIGDQLFVSEKTVRNQLTTVYDKLGVSSQVELCLKTSDIGYCKLADQNYDWDNCPEKSLKKPEKSG
jgi:DNA-binding NarL/FixJ family response regulator